MVIRFETDEATFRDKNPNQRLKKQLLVKINHLLSLKQENRSKTELRCNKRNKPIASILDEHSLI